MGKKTVNYSEHVLVPKHEKLSDKQKQQILAEYNCKIENLPRIKAGDVAISDLTAKSGDIIRVKRESKIEGESYFYRVVIDE